MNAGSFIKNIIIYFIRDQRHATVDRIRHCMQKVLVRCFNGLITTFQLGPSLLQVLMLASAGEGRK